MKELRTFVATDGPIDDLKELIQIARTQLEDREDANLAQIEQFCSHGVHYVCKIGWQENLDWHRWAERVSLSKPHLNRIGYYCVSHTVEGLSGYGLIGWVCGD